MLHVVGIVVGLAAITYLAPCVFGSISIKNKGLIQSAVFAIYLIVYVYFAFFSRAMGLSRGIELKPFVTYAYLLGEANDTNRYGTVFEIIGLNTTSPIVGILLNILLYYPLGYLLPILFSKLKPKHIILIGCLCSIATEATQYLLKMGWCETDDVIHNTLGTAIGVWIWHLQSKRLNTPKSNNLPKD
ncbi:MAG: VanZ family protein [Clostridia bacterium]|nr:VanZ family protein [Clostridia bacterium]